MVNCLNYTEQGGSVTHFGGTVIFEEGCDVQGLPGSGGGAAENQKDSKATTVAGLKDDFNALLAKLKAAGLMDGNTWNITAGLAPTPTEEEGVANNNAVDSVTYADGKVTVAVNLDDLVAFPSSNPAQGTHKWVALCIGTGFASITDVTYGGEPLTAQDVADADATGCPAGSFVLYIKAEEVAETGKTITLGAEGYPDIDIAIEIVAVN